MNNISSKENKKVKYLKKLLASSSFRREEGVFAAEGLRLCGDAIKSGCTVVSAFFSESFVEKNGDFVREAQARCEEAFVLTDSLFSSVSDTKTPQGVLFVIKRLDKNLDFDTMKDNGKVLALESVQDPVNLGTILRTAEAFGIGAVILTRDCCDIYSPKTARGSMGAVFRLPFYITDDLPAFIEGFNAFGVSYAAVLDQDSVSLNDCSFEGAALAVVGNEGNGLSDAVIGACTHKLYIPMSGKAESLNVSAAAAIILWEMKND